MMLRMCMDNHIYQFKNHFRIKNQINRGNSRGNDWDKKLQEKLKIFRMIPDIYIRFKDDIEINKKGTFILNCSRANDSFKQFGIICLQSVKYTFRIVKGQMRILILNHLCLFHRKGRADVDSLLVQDRLYTHPCVYRCVCRWCMVSSI